MKLKKMKILKKNIVVFGFSAFVINPILKPDSGLKVPEPSPISILFFDLKVLYPIYIKYAAPKYFNIENNKMDFEIITARPAIE